MIDKYIEKKDDEYYRRDRSWTDKFDIRHGAKILDIGCGQGLFGKYLHESLDAKVTGIEVVESCYLEAKTVLDEAHLGDIETMDLTILDSDYDYIIFSDCLEHLINPDIVLSRIKKLLKKDGHLLISIPNVQNFRITLPLILRGSWEYKDEGLMDRTHLRWFTKSSIISLVESNGFRLMQLDRELPLNSFSGIINLLTFTIFKNHLTSHFYLKSCLANS
jgi:2-polyprenyl-3-methyl-5-hydroxy-6-metoxy-1,4-benzoquinol methylase